MDGLDFCFRDRRWSEDTCGHEECKRIGDIVTPYLCQLARLREEVERLTRERDALLGRLTGRCDDQWGGHFALVEIRPSPFSVTDHHGRSNHVALCQWCETEAQAVAAARRAAGLAGEG